MPVVLSPKEEEIWLDYGNRAKEELIKILLSSKLTDTEIYPVSSDVSKAGNNYPELIDRLKDSKI